MLGWWAAAWGAEGPCEEYLEQRLGRIDSAPVVLVQCWNDQHLEAELQWRGPGGDVVTPLPHRDAWEARIEAGALDGNTLSYTLLTSTNSPYHSPDEEARIAVLDSTTHGFTFAPGVAPPRPASFTARLAAGDRIVAAGVGSSGNPIQQAIEWSDTLPVIARAVRDAALVDHRARLDRRAADRILGHYANDGDGSRVPGLDSEALTEGLAEDAAIEVYNDLGFLLDVGGEHRAAASLLRRVVDAKPDRAVALLNYADALWNLGEPDALHWYQAYLDALGPKGDPVKRARSRAKSPPPAPTPTKNDAEARFAAALDAGDLEVARGAASSGGFVPQQRLAWWRAGAREIDARLARGDDEGARILVEWLDGRGMPLPTGADFDAVLRPLAVRIAAVPGIHFVLTVWLRTPRTPEEAVALARSSEPGHGTEFYAAALKLTGTDAVSGIHAVEGRLCVDLLLGRRRCSGDDPLPAGRSDPDPASWMTCTRAQWPCFEVSARAGDYECERTDEVEVCAADRPGTGEGHACGADPAGNLRCTGLGSLPSRTPPEGEGYLWAATSATHACGLHPDHHVACWGDDGHGQAPARLEGVTDVAVGPGWSCTLGLDGRVRCLGDAPKLPAMPEPPSFLDARDFGRRLR